MINIDNTINKKFIGIRKNITFNKFFREIKWPMFLQINILVIFQQFTIIPCHCIDCFYLHHNIFNLLASTTGIGIVNISIHIGIRVDIYNRI